MTTKASLEEISMTALLRVARTTYTTAIRGALAQAGFKDIPKSGLWILDSLAEERGPVSFGRVIERLRVTKQSVSQLVDTLVARDYLKRAADPVDRRKLIITLTKRGRAAAAVQTSAREKLDAKLAACVGPENVRCTRRTLAALAEMTLLPRIQKHLRTTFSGL